MNPQVKIWQVLVNDLCRQAVEARLLTLKTYGDQERNFLPLTDVCNAIAHLIRLESNRAGAGLFYPDGRLRRAGSGPAARSGRPAAGAGGRLRPTFPKARRVRVRSRGGGRMEPE